MFNNKCFVQSITEKNLFYVNFQITTKKKLIIKRFPIKMQYKKSIISIHTSQFNLYNYCALNLYCLKS